jgi:hypothetical protein
MIVRFLSPGFECAGCHSEHFSSRKHKVAPELGLGAADCRHLPTTAIFSAAHPCAKCRSHCRVRRRPFITVRISR